MEKKTPKVGEKIVTKIYGSTIQVLIKQVKPIEGGFWYKGIIKGYDKSDYGKSDLRKGETKGLLHEVTIEGFMDEFGNWGD